MSQAIRGQGTQIQRAATSVVTPQTISSITVVGSLATVTTAVAHGLATGALVTLAGTVPSAYVGTFSITVLTATTFTYTTATAPGGPATTVGTYTAQALTYATVEEATSIKLGGVTLSSIETTHLLSTSKEFMAGLKDNTTCDVACNFTNGAVQALMRADCNAGTTSSYRILIPNGSLTTTISFSAFHTKFAGPEAKTDSELEIQISLKITGDVTTITA